MKAYYCNGRSLFWHKVVALLSIVASGMHGLAYLNGEEGGWGSSSSSSKGSKAHHRDRRDDDGADMVFSGTYGHG